MVCKYYYAKQTTNGLKLAMAAQMLTFLTTIVLPASRASALASKNLVLSDVIMAGFIRPESR